MKRLIQSAMLSLFFTAGMATEIKEQKDQEAPFLSQNSLIVPVDHNSCDEQVDPQNVQQKQKKLKLLVMVGGATFIGSAILYNIHKHYMCKEDPWQNAYQTQARESLFNTASLNQWYAETCWAYMKEATGKYQYASSWCQYLMKTCECSAEKNDFMVPILDIKSAHCNPEKVLKMMSTIDPRLNNTFFEVFRHHAQELYGNHSEIPSVEYFTKSVYEFIQTACNSTLNAIYRPITANFSGSTLSITHYENKSEIFTNPLCLKVDCVKDYVTSKIPCNQKTLLSDVASYVATPEYWIGLFFFYWILSMFGS